MVIFERSVKRLTGSDRTWQGGAVNHRALAGGDNLTQAGHEYAAQDSGTLTVVVTHTQARYALPQVVQSFRADIGIATEGLAEFPGLVWFPCYRWSHVVVAPMAFDHGRDCGLRAVEVSHLFAPT